MVVLRMDRRLANRVDASDVVQDAMIDAAHKLPGFARQRPIAFYPWLRRIAWQRLVDLHRKHVLAEKRSVLREEQGLALSDQSVVRLANRLLAHTMTASEKMIRSESRRQIRGAIARLPSRDREVLVMLYLEQLSIDETSESLGITRNATIMRHLRALERLKSYLNRENRG
jgi:RNA polymerase sigma-70 factor (ECF subfamily)